ncbi:uncharacterized protein M6B38_405495 [Iris pallida]|uniref:Uncharacterized protein n=1 Tax=Iris pallida TaxID=29817 RepID=A0AAX6FQJ9_IRIPA|nr:uncharacterized protein M6B38_405495 [Iris pallida]
MGFYRGLRNAVLVLYFVAAAVEIGGVSAQNSQTCTSRFSPCYRRKIVCPKECPFTKPGNPKDKACFLDCSSPKCEAVCRGRKPNCNGVGSGCYDPRFVSSDGSVFYFHGKRDEHFSIVSDPGLQINARFIGLRPSGRTRDFTWIQALGLMFGPHSLTAEAARAERWDDFVDHLVFSFDGEPLRVPEGHLSEWRSADGEAAIERTGSRNSVVISIEGIAEVSISAVPITEEDDRVHGYGIPTDDCFGHLEVQFRFVSLSPEVEGVLGRTYRPGFVNPGKRGVPMPVVGGEEEYRTSSLVSPDCKLCLFSPAAADS